MRILDMYWNLPRRVRLVLDGFGVGTGLVRASQKVAQLRSSHRERFTCGSRKATLSAYSLEEGQDRWERRGKLHCCSFCGCIHPDEMIDLLENRGAQLETTTKTYKIYIEHPWAREASGSGKCYTWHWPPKEESPRFWEIVREHEQAARERLRGMMDELHGRATANA